MGPASTLRAWGLPLLLAVAGACGVAGVDGASWTSDQWQKVLFEAPGADSSLECVPSQMPSGDRCHYINANWQMCQVSSGLVPYLYIHYCYFASWPWLSVVLMVAWVLLLFLVLMVAADRFFCPALEVIADYLEIPPDVAGATLLAFGNGAPDLFTQMAAISSGDEQGLAMALGEPIGGGLFVTNVVLAIVILASPTASFRVEPWPFLRDSVAYTGSLLLVVGLTKMGTVAWWSCAILLAYYGLYVAVMLLSKGATEPTRIEQSKHFQEVVSEPGHLRVLESLHFSPLARPNLQRASAPAAYVPPAPLSLPASPRYLQGQPADSSSSAPATASAANGMQPLAAASTAASTASSMLSSSAEAAISGGGLLGAAAEEGNRAATSKEVVACSDAVAATAAASAALQASLSFAEWDGEDAPPQGGVVQPRASALQQPLLPPQPAGGQRAALCIPVAAAAAAAELDSEAAMQEGQAEEQAALGTVGCSPFAVLKAPIVLVLRLTMPEKPGQLLGIGRQVGMDNDVNYPKVFAVLLPVCAPLFVVLVKRVAFTEFGINGLLYGLCCSAFSTSIIWSIYPSDGRHYGVLSGVFTVMTFLIAIIWLNVAAGEVVATSRALGYVFGVNQDILGATVLAWGNSVPDMVADVTMARDGFPSMALAACFASPMFALVVGSAASWGSRIFATGSSIPYSLRPALLMGLLVASASMLRFIATVPLLHRWRMGPAVAVLSLLIYAAFQCAYLYLELAAPSSSGGGSARDLAP